MVARAGAGRGARRLSRDFALDMARAGAHWNGTFSASSYGFRPGRSAHQAVSVAQALIASGCRIVVDLDIEKFLDTASYCPVFYEVRSKSSGCRGHRFDSESFLLAAHNMDGVELAALDTLQNGLA